MNPAVDLTRPPSCSAVKSRPSSRRSLGKAGQRERWIRSAYESIQRRPQVKAVIWFNYDKRREGEPNWRIDRTPESLRAFNETFAAPRKTNN